MTDSIIPLQIILVARLCIYILSPLIIDTPWHKRARYTPDMIPATISVASENYVGDLTNPSDSLDILITDDTNTLNIIKKYTPLKGSVHREYCCRKQGRKYATKDKVILLHML